MALSVVERQETSTRKHCQKFEGHTDWVTDVIHLLDGQRMMTCSFDGSLRVWNLKSGKQIGKDCRDGDRKVWTIALSPDGKKVVSGSDDGGVRLWDIDTGKLVAKWMGHTDAVYSVCWSRDGHQVASGSLDGTAREWDVENGDAILGPIKTGHKNVYAIVYSPDMTMFATAGYNESKHAIKIWDAKTRELVASLTSTDGHTSSVWCLAWCPDGKTLISGSDDGSIRTWNTRTWKQLALLNGHTSGVYDITISPNGRILASASLDYTAQLWNLDNSKPISPPLHHARMVDCVSFSADGKLLSAGCDDKNAYTWGVFAILKDAGLDDLLLDQPEKSLLAADATRHPVRQPVKVSPRIPRGFFDDTPHLSARPHSLSSPSHKSLRSRLLSLFRPIRPDAHDTQSRPLPFHRVRSRLSGGTDIQLHEHPSAVVDVPLCQAKPRNASGRYVRPSIPNPIQTNATAGNSRPSNSTIAQQSSGTAQAQSSSQPHAIVSTVPPVVANTTSTASPRAIIKYPTRWTRFWLFICCASLEYTDGHS